MDGLLQFTTALQSVINLVVKLMRFMYKLASTVVELKNRSTFCVNSEKVPKASAQELHMKTTKLANIWNLANTM